MLLALFGSVVFKMFLYISLIIYWLGNPSVRSTRSSTVLQNGTPVLEYIIYTLYSAKTIDLLCQT